jgi:hypothetical protein
MSKTETRTEVEPSTGSIPPRVRHIVALDPETGEATDKCLCGYLWDQLHVPHNGTMCQECVDVLKAQGKG